MVGSQRGGTNLPRDPRDRRNDLDINQQLSRGLDRGVISAPPLEDLLVGQDMLLTLVDVGTPSFLLRGIGAQITDVASGNLTVALYRVVADDVLPTRFIARLFASKLLAAAATPQEAVAVFNVDKEIDRNAGAYIVGVMGSTPTMYVRGTESYTAPSFGGWSLAAPGAPPAQIESAQLAWSLRVPSVSLLTQTGVRFRGTGAL